MYQNQIIRLSRNTQMTLNANDDIGQNIVFFLQKS